MGLIRIVLYMLCGVIVWHIGKRLFRSMTSMTEEQHSVLPSLQKRGSVVRCAHCGLHIPKQEAVIHRDDLFFCCEEHRKAFIVHQK